MITMVSRGSSTSRSSRTFAECSPYFPKAAGPGSLPGRSITLPIRPQSPGPVGDGLNAGKPIAQFDDVVHASSFVPRPDGIDTDLPPQQPENFHDAYLMPSLTRHERLRLTMFWYYTRGLLEDEDFLKCLQEKLELVQVLIGWEYAIVGLVSENVFTRLVSAGLPLAIVPRRESPCSHTINQEPGTVFMLPDMINDWRFRQSPQVALGGLRAYAGAQLRCKALNGEEIALGSLCVAASAKQPALSAAQQEVLVRFADVISSELVNRSREARKRQRHHMAYLLADARIDGSENAEERILGILRQVYPGATANVQTSPHGTIRLANHATVDYEDFEGGLWEDGDLIEKLIETCNHTKLETTETVRAIAHPCHTYLEARYLVVTSSKVQNVFDDVDAWFIESCATQLRHAIQESHLKEALKAKETFMRGITHQLRTPIHGVLVSCELLAEELARLNLASSTMEESATPSTSSALNTIRESARELMSTINNILKMNKWAENLRRPEPVSVRSLRQMELDIMYELQQLVPERKLEEISIFVENRIPVDDATLEIDITLLKECIQALVLNAMQYTEDGAVVVVISTPTDHSRLVIDVCDTGIGIDPENQQLIFEAYEKVDPHSRGAGLGLTLTRKIAAAMDGNVTLESSSQDLVHHGSHFCVEFYSPRFAMPQRQINNDRTPRPGHPRTLHTLPSHEPHAELMATHFAKHLERHGYQDVDVLQAAVVIVPYTADADQLSKLVESVKSRQVAVCLLPAGASPASLPQPDNRTVLYFTGPFLSSALDTIRQEIETACRKIDEDPAQSEESIRSAGSASSPPTSAEPFALLVDDNLINLRILRMYCERRNIPYVTAVDGQEAVLRFQEVHDNHKKGTTNQQAINLVLMDLQMPVCDGVEATARIRAMEKERALHPCHIFMVTGQDSVADKNRSFEAGADEFYVKPMSLKDLDRGIGDRFAGFKRRPGPGMPKKEG